MICIGIKIKIMRIFRSFFLIMIMILEVINNKAYPRYLDSEGRGWGRVSVSKDCRSETIPARANKKSPL